MTRRIVLLLLACTGVFAEDALPSAESLLDRYAEVTYNHQPQGSLKGLIAKATVAYPTYGLRGGQVVYLSEGGLFYSYVEVPGRFTIEQGVKDGQGWEKSSTAGPRLMDQVETSQLLRNTIDSVTHWREHYLKVETLGEEEVDGEWCYRVRATPRLGRPETLFLSKEHGWVTRYSSTWAVRDQAVAVDTIFEDYREFGGFLFPAKMALKTPDMEFRAVIHALEVNPEITPDRYNLPVDVVALARRGR